MREQRNATRSGATEAVALASYLLVVIVLGLVSLEPRFGTPWWIAALLGAVGVGVLRARHRHPIAALGGALGATLLSLAVGTGAECLLPLIALHGVGVRRRAALAWQGFAVALAAGAVGAWIFVTRLSEGPSLWGSPPVTPRDVTVDGLIAFAVVAVALVIAALLGINAGQRRRWVEALVDRAERLARERDQQAEIASARERERIAREMHDVIAHSLSVMIALADGALAASDERPAEARTAIARTAETGRRTLGEVRRLLGAVRGEHDSAHAPQPDASQLAALVEEFHSAGLPVRLRVSGPPSPDAAVGLTVYRLVQESLTNVLRHSRGLDEVAVVVAWAATEVEVVVRDSASAAVPSEHEGRGILGMRERVALFGGSIEAGPHDEGGWQVSARLRWEEEPT